MPSWTLLPYKDISVLYKLIATPSSLGIFGVATCLTLHCTRLAVWACPALPSTACVQLRYDESWISRR